MTKAHALRNYFKRVYDVDNLTGMSELAVWKEFLKENSSFDSLASTMTGLYTEMADNEISIGSGGGGSAKILMAIAGTEDNMVADYSSSISDGVTKYYPCIKLTGIELPKNLKTGDLLYYLSSSSVGVAIYNGTQFMDLPYDMQIRLDTLTNHNGISLIMQSSDTTFSTQQEALGAATYLLPTITQSNPRFVFLQDPLGISAPNIGPRPEFDPPGGGAAN